MSFTIEKAPRKVHMFSLRATKELHAAIKAAAESNHHSVNSEITDRLTRSVVADDLVGGSPTATFLHLLGATIADIEAQTGKSWLQDLDTWHKAQEAISMRLSERKPSSRR